MAIKYSVNTQVNARLFKTANSIKSILIIVPICKIYAPLSGTQSSEPYSYLSASWGPLSLTRVPVRLIKARRLMTKMNLFWKEILILNKQVVGF